MEHPGNMNLQHLSSLQGWLSQQQVPYVNLQDIQEIQRQDALGDIALICGTLIQALPQDHQNLKTHLTQRLVDNIKRVQKEEKKKRSPRRNRSRSDLEDMDEDPRPGHRPTPPSSQGSQQDSSLHLKIDKILTYFGIDQEGSKIFQGQGIQPQPLPGKKDKPKALKQQHLYYPKPLEELALEQLKQDLTSHGHSGQIQQQEEINDWIKVTIEVEASNQIKLGKDLKNCVDMRGIADRFYVHSLDTTVKVAGTSQTPRKAFKKASQKSDESAMRVN